jgi:hypothetical protein
VQSGYQETIDEKPYRYRRSNAASTETEWNCLRVCDKVVCLQIWRATTTTNLLLARYLVLGGGDAVKSPSPRGKKEDEEEPRRRAS